jgi:hypothetical protein
MTPQAWLLLLLVLFMPNQQSAQPGQKPSETVLRDPFTLKLKLNDGSNFEQRFDQVPYVKDGSVYIFSGEAFGIAVKTDGDKITDVSYEKDATKDDILLKFEQMSTGKTTMMMLTIQNKLKQDVQLDASMRLPKRDGAYKTSILPVLAGKSGFESWPHPIAVLELRNFRFYQRPAKP